MTDTQKNAIVEQMRHKIETAGISQNRLATLAKVSGATVSNILQGKWDVVADAMWRKIRQALGMGESAIDTSQFVSIMDTLVAAKIGAEARIIDGRTGLGKTAASKHFQANRPEETYLVRCSGDMTAKEFLAEIARAVGADDGGTLAQIRQAISKKLSRDRMPIVILDEAENLRERAYVSLKALYDDLEGRAGIVLIGANDYLGWLQRQASRKRPGCFPQIYSRFKQGATSLGPMTKDDVVACLSAYGITDKATVNQMFSTCADYRDLFRAIRDLTKEAA
jgi:DNA transposition AAA+ family ATPase